MIAFNKTRIYSEHKIEEFKELNYLRFLLIIILLLNYNFIIMKISHEKTHLFVKEAYLPDLASRKCIHLISFSCWFLMIFFGTLIIGIGASNNSVTYSYCSDSQSFCTKNVLFNDSSTYFFYIKLTNFHQNNRM